MASFIKEDTEINHDVPFTELKVLNNTTITLKHKNSWSSNKFDFDKFPSLASDNSFELGLHQQNVDVLKEASIKYLEESCFPSQFDLEKGFNDQNLYIFMSYKGESKYDIFDSIKQNQLLSESQKKQFQYNIEGQQDLIKFLQIVQLQFNDNVAKEIIFISYKILNRKLRQFKEKIIAKNGCFPRFNCFWGENEDNFLTTSCPIYEQINYDEVIGFAEVGINSLASEIFSSKEIKYLNFKQLKAETKPITNLISNFRKFLQKISKVIFLSMTGMTENNENYDFSDLFRWNSTEEKSEEFFFNTNHSLARDMPQVNIELDENQESLSKPKKKVKKQ